jgi:DnaJ-class molecular chaperone
MNKPVQLLGALALTAGLVACGIGISEDPTPDAGNPWVRDGSSDGQADAGGASRGASAGVDAGRGGTDASQPGQPDASTKSDAGRADASQPGSPDSGVPAKDAGNGATGHDLILGNGIAHKAGNTDPLKNCVSCHGSKLQGGQGPSCYKCHDNDDHTKNRDGKKHQVGSRETCHDCHGPNNSGGLGPACTTCHQHQ